MALFSNYRKNNDWIEAVEIVRVHEKVSYPLAQLQVELRMVLGGEPPTPHHRQVLEHIAADIRGHKK